jgi:hypothetical protein
MTGISPDRDVPFLGVHALDTLDGSHVPTRAEIRAHLIANGGMDSLEALAAFSAVLPEEKRSAFLAMYHDEHTAMLEAQRHAVRARRLLGLAAIVVVAVLVWALLK